MKRIIPKLAPGVFWLAATLVSSVAISALAQSASPSGQIGPGTPSNPTLKSALAPQTRQTLLEAMEAVDSPALGNPADSSKEVMLSWGECAKIDQTGVTRVPFVSVPAQLKAALNGDIVDR